MSFIDGLFICCGIYIVYQSFTMKKDGRIPEGLMINKGTIIPKDADIIGFILFMYWKGIITGIAACISGLLGVLSTNRVELQTVSIFGYFGFVAVITWFIIFLKKAHHKYLHIK